MNEINQDEITNAQLQETIAKGVETGIQRAIISNKTPMKKMMSKYIPYAAGLLSAFIAFMLYVMHHLQ